MRLIDADALPLEPYGEDVISWYATGWNDAINVINRAPTVDAVPVVRCKNCMYWTRVSERMGKCPFLIGEHQYAGDNHYCSCGERREEDAVD